MRLFAAPSCEPTQVQPITKCRAGLNRIIVVQSGKRILASRAPQHERDARPKRKRNGEQEQLSHVFLSLFYKKRSGV